MSLTSELFLDNCRLCDQVKEIVQKARLASAGSRITRGPCDLCSIDGEGCGWEGAEGLKIRVLEPRIMDPFSYIPLCHKIGWRSWPQGHDLLSLDLAPLKSAVA